MSWKIIAQEYVSKPKKIKAIKFLGLSTNFEGLKITKDEGGFKIYNNLHNSWIGIKKDDFIRVDNPDDFYPIDKDYFASNYEAIPINADDLIKEIEANTKKIK